MIITIPITITIAIWLCASREWKMSLLWCSLFAVAMILVLATKIAFIGWGIGIQALDFTGISGHATRAAMVFPVLFYYGFQRAPRRINHIGVYIGMALGVAISMSRIVIHVHSGSEVVSGWLLGTGLSLIYLGSMKNHIVFTSRRWLVVCCFSMLFVSPALKPVQPDELIVDLALYLSGHDRPFERSDWRNTQLSLRRLVCNPSIGS